MTATSPTDITQERQRRRRTPKAKAPEAAPTTPEPTPPAQPYWREHAAHTAYSGPAWAAWITNSPDSCDWTQEALAEARQRLADTGISIDKLTTEELGSFVRNHLCDMYEEAQAAWVADSVPAAQADEVTDVAKSTPIERTKGAVAALNARVAEQEAAGERPGPEAAAPEFEPHAGESDDADDEPALDPHQIGLLPPEPLRHQPVRVVLAELPPNKELPGPDPDPNLLYSIQTFGLQQPVTLTRVGGRYLVIDGRRRVKALRRLWTKDEQRTTPVDALLATSDENPDGPWRHTLAISMNAVRKENPVSDLKAIQAMLAAGAGPHLIAACARMGIGKVKKRIALLNLPAVLVEGVLAGRIAIGVAESVISLHDEARERLAAKFQADGSLTAEDVDAEHKVRAAEAMGGMQAAMDTLLEQIPAPAEDPAGTGELTASMSFTRHELQLAQAAFEAFAMNDATGEYTRLAERAMLIADWLEREQRDVRQARADRADDELDPPDLDEDTVADLTARGGLRELQPV